MAGSVGEHGGLDEISIRSAAVPPATSWHLLSARIDKPQYVFPLALGDERPNLRCRVEPRTEHGFAGGVGNALDDALELLFLHIQTGAGRTNLALIEKDGRARRPRRQPPDRNRQTR